MRIKTEFPEKTKFKISFSEYSTYLNCQHKWYLQYVLKLKSDLSEDLIFGSAIHATIEKIFTNETVKKLYSKDLYYTSQRIFKEFLNEEIEKYKKDGFEEELKKLFSSEEKIKFLVYQGTNLLVKLDLVKTFKDYELVEVEHKLEDIVIYSTEEYDLTYKGFIDIILRNKLTNQYLILDWKTSRKSWDIRQKLQYNPDHFAQLALYKYFYSKEKELSFKEIDTKFFNLPREEPNKLKQFKGELDEEYILDFIDRFILIGKEVVGKRILSENFEKAKLTKKKNMCFFCQFNNDKYCNQTDFYQKILV